MSQYSFEASPRFTARMAGIFQLLEGLTSPFGQVIVLKRLVVTGDAAATAANILSHERLFWLGFASCTLGVVFHIAWALLLYDLFKPVRRRLAVFATCVILVGCAIQAVAALLYLAPLSLLRGGALISAFSAEQSRALALSFLGLNAYAYDLYIVFFGLWCFLIGILILRSTFMPRLLGALIAISGVGWMFYLWPPLADRLFFPYLTVASAIGEFPLELWLIIMAINAEKWYKQAAEAAKRQVLITAS